MPVQQHALLEGVRKLKDLLEALFRDPTSHPVFLFAGAGVGARAGLVEWKGFISHLASVAEQYEPETAGLIKKRYRHGLLADAAHYYKCCLLIPKGELYKQLAWPFRQDAYDARMLHHLVMLPFKGIATTNYDRSLHDAYALVYHKTALPAELGQSLKSVAFDQQGSFYIARVHGRAEEPETMVVDSDDYERTEDNADYTDCLTDLLTKKTCLFIGFSFIDPAIDWTLRLLEARVQPSLRRKHYALVPEGDESEELAIRLARHNIEVYRYDPANGHEELWEAIRFAAANLKVTPPSPPPTMFPLALELARKLLAVCYVRAKLGERAGPLREVIFQGLVMGVVAEQKDRPSTYQGIVQNLRKVVGLTDSELSPLVRAATQALTDRGWLESRGEAFGSSKTAPDELTPDLQLLADGVVDRLLVRENLKCSQELKELILKLVQEMILARGWDLGAHLAGAQGVLTDDLLTKIRKAVSHMSSGKLTPDVQEKVGRACEHLFVRPDEREAKILVELGRISFGIEAVVDTGRSAFYGFALPHNLYLDSNVLMPMIVDGHPFRPVYQATVRKLQDAAVRNSATAQFLISSSFVNEVLTHKQLAVQMVKELGLDDPPRLRKHVLWLGAENTNVFIGAYSSWVGREQRQVPFDEFLNTVAPFQSEAELKEYLIALGFHPVSLSRSSAKEEAVFQTLTQQLLEGYEKDLFERPRTTRKPRILIEHEASQLARLSTDLSAGIRSVFVTADTRLQRIARQGIDQRVVGAIISHLGLIQLVDLLVGIEADSKSLARMMWAIRAADTEFLLRRYFVDLALPELHATLQTKTLAAIVDDLVPQMAKDGRLEKIHFTAPLYSLHDHAVTARFLDRFENRFFENMREAIEREEKRGKK